jgi:hypothetical protein
MVVNVQIQLAGGEPPLDPTAAAEAVLAALGGDPSADVCTVSVAAGGRVGPESVGSAAPPQGPLGG